MRSSESEYLTAREVANELGVDIDSVYRAVNRNQLPAVRLMPKGSLRIPRSAIEPGQRPRTC